jgi:hypothetical protein
VPRVIRFVYNTLANDICADTVSYPLADTLTNTIANDICSDRVANDICSYPVTNNLRADTIADPLADPLADSFSICIAYGFVCIVRRSA